MHLEDAFLGPPGSRDVRSAPLKTTKGQWTYRQWDCTTVFLDLLRHVTVRSVRGNLPDERTYNLSVHDSLASERAACEQHYTGRGRNRSIRRLAQKN